jgi:hypothetical protein
MARALAIGVTPSASNPILDLWVLASGLPADASAVTFDIWDLTTGVPVHVTGPTAATHLTTGRYLAPWTGAGTAGRKRVIWSVTPSTGPAYAQQYDFDLLVAGLSQKGPAYALLADVRDEGYTSTVVSDIRALTVIRKVSMFIERWTRRFFEPRYMTIDLDGARGPSQFVQDPIIALVSAAVDGALVDPTSYQVFNRHIAEGLTNPDDRDNARVTFQRITRTISQVDSQDRPFFNKQVWWPGPRNVELIGLFGYTDPDPDLQVGVTPELIKHAALLLFEREYRPMSDGDGRQDAQNAFRVTSIRTRDQSITYGKDRSDLVTQGAAEFTGDPAIDDIIAQYMAPMFIGSP